MAKRKLPLVIRNKVTGTIYKLVCEVKSYGNDIIYSLAYVNRDEKLCNFLVNNYNSGFAYDVMFRQLDADVNWEVVKK